MSDAQPHLMVIGAHAGDAEISAGGVVLSHVMQGRRATLVHLTLGAKGHPTLSEEAYAGQKQREAEAAAHALGAQLVILPYRDGELYTDEETKLALADVIRREKPDIIITHWKNSIHKDHANTYHIVEDAVFYAAIRHFQRADAAHSVRSIYYAENWEDPGEFEPEVYLEITAAYEGWLQAVQCYELFRGGLSRFPYLDYYKALARVRGAQSGFTYAEAFAIPPLARRRRLTSF